MNEQGYRVTIHGGHLSGTSLFVSASSESAATEQAIETLYESLPYSNGGDYDTITTEVLGGK
jgi:hypothetical protein